MNDDCVTVKTRNPSKPALGRKVFVVNSFLCFDWLKPELTASLNEPDKTRFKNRIPCNSKHPDS